MIKILIIRFTALGDLVMCEPFIRATKKCSEKSHIDFLTTNLGKSLYNDYEYIDNIIIYETFFKTLSQINHTKYDMIINLHCNRISHYLTLFSNTKKVINISSNLFQKTFKIKHKSKSIEEILQLMNIESIKINSYINSDLNYDKVIFPKNSTLLTLPFESNNKIIGISTGCSEKWTTKQWGIQRYSELISKLLLNNFKIVLIGTKLELNDAKILEERFGKKILSFVDKTNIPELKILISKFDLFIGNDSGPTHIAAALGINTITIFGSTSERHCVKNLPYLGKHICMTPDNSILCHPCYKSKCPTKMECMESIRAEVVFEKALELLKIQNN